MARLAICAVASMAACGGGGDETPATGMATETVSEEAARRAQRCVARSERLQMVSGDGQTGMPGAALAQRPTVRLSCESAARRGGTLLLTGANIVWRHESGPVTLVDGQPQVTRKTAADGTSAVVWTLAQTNHSTMRIEARHQPTAGAALTMLFSASTSGTTTDARRCGDAVGTDHGGALSLTSPTTWSAAGSPHRGGTVTLASDAARLSIEAGAVVCVDRIEGGGAFRYVLAAGTAQAPIRFIGTALRASAELAHVIGDNMPAVGTAAHPVGALLDSSFGWSQPRDPALCAQVVVGDMGGGGGASLNRVSIKGYGSAACAALVLIEPVSAWDYGSVPIEVRVQGSIGDGIAVAPIINTAMSIDFVNCEVSASGRHGIVVAANPKATASWVSAGGCNLYGNGGKAIVNQSTEVVSAIGNWWGDPAGPQGPSGDGTSGAVDASGALGAARVLGY